MSVKINTIHLENVKRVKAIQLQPSPDGLTIIGGDNVQGKTSVLDAIAWALGGGRFKPTTAKREGAAGDPVLYVELSNGLIVERKGKNSSLKVTDPTGERGNQSLLDSFISELALDLPKFMNSNDADKAKILLQLLGVEEELERLKKLTEAAYNKRHAIGQIATQKRKYADELPFHPDAPEKPILPSELIKQQQIILAKNGENQRLRDQLGQLEQNRVRTGERLIDVEERIKELMAQREQIKLEAERLDTQLMTARKTVEQLQDESTAEIEASIANIEAINAKVTINSSKAKAELEAEEYEAQYAELDEEVNKHRTAQTDLLKGARLPLDGLMVNEDGLLTYKGHAWDGMSGAEQLKVATAIVKELKPECGFVLLDRLEAFDHKALTEFGEWLKEQDLQAIATRVSTGGECTIIIEDGYVQGQDARLPEPPLRQEKPAVEAPVWEAKY